MPHETTMENRSWLKRALRRFRPGHVVNLCFVAVMIFSTLLTWREVAVLEDAYISSQQNHLDSVANVLDRQLQFNVDKLIFLRNGMHDALLTPLDFAVLHGAVAQFEQRRKQRFWQLELDRRRTLSLNGVSDELVDQATLLTRDNANLANELTAALEAGYLMRLAHSSASMAHQAMYVSRSGFYVATQPTTHGADILTRYYGYVTQPWFKQQTQRLNPQRGVRWFVSPANATREGQQMVTVSVPLDHENYWYGVLAMDIPVLSIKRFLEGAIVKDVEGEYQLYDSQFRLLATSTSEKRKVNVFDEQEQAMLVADMAKDTVGGKHVGSRYISWERLDNFDGVLVRVHTLKEGLKGDFGSISIALGLLWMLVTAMLLISWGVIRHMVSNMFVMQNSLQWQAWHDTLTRLFNRGGLFEKARIQAKRSQEGRRPFSVIQLDLDHFKSVNDRFGHQAGDRVLSHAAGLISGTLRAHDLAGRVGGEEFCIILPGATLAQAERIAERISRRINGKEILVAKSTTIWISASFGVSSSQETGDYDIEQLQSLADQRLYWAKQTGRNRVCASDADQSMAMK